MTSPNFVVNYFTSIVVNTNLSRFPITHIMNEQLAEKHSAWLTASLK